MTATSALTAPTGSDPLIGAVVGGRYRIEEWIGAGQMARVYRARHVRLSRAFAVKVLPGARAADPLMRLRFAQEADAASSLDHPNLVSVVDFGRIDSGELYLVMDLVEGESLGRLIARDGRLAPLRAITLTRALARGLGHAHERGLVHRDFKPDNVVLERVAGGELLPRILDFGLAIHADPDDGEPRLTEEGFVVGTPIYLAPEQACAEPVDRRADLYALGVVLFEMLAGRPPFDGGPVEVARRKLVEPPPPIALHPAAAPPPELEAVVRRLLAQYPEDRFQTAGDLVAALDLIEARLAQPALPRPPVRAERLAPRPEAGPPPPRRWRLAIAAAAVAAAVAAGFSAGGDQGDAAGPASAAPAATGGPAPRATSGAVAAGPTRAAAPPPPGFAAPAGQPAARAAPPSPAAADQERARLAREYREVGEALDRLHGARGAAAAAPFEARYLDISFADSLRVPSLRRETLARLAALRRAIRAAGRGETAAAP